MNVSFIVFKQPWKCHHPKESRKAGKQNVKFSRSMKINSILDRKQFLPRECSSVLDKLLTNWINVLAKYLAIVYWTCFHVFKRKILIWIREGMNKQIILFTKIFLSRLFSSILFISIYINYLHLLLRRNIQLLSRILSYF